VLSGALPVALVEGAHADALRLQDGRLMGRIGRVPDAAMSGAFLVLAGDYALLVPSREGVSVTPLPSMDPTRPIAEVEFVHAHAIQVGAARGGVAGLRREAIVLSCADAVGGIQRTVDASVEYGKVRTQFDKPIGSFQAVKHRCADMATRAEMARAATIYATVAVREAASDADFQVSVAKILCANAYVQNAGDNVQNHGGMGFTWECDAHLFVKRARSFDLTLGSRARQLDALVERFRAA
jgi:alkylation response protein AidB-like acyl-CoA dehydrogenase